MVQFGFNYPPLAGHQSDVVIAVNGRQDAVPAFFADCFQPHHQGGSRRWVRDFSPEPPDRALPFCRGRGLQTDFGKGADGAVVPFLQAAQIEIGRKRLGTAR